MPGLNRGRSPAYSRTAMPRAAYPSPAAAAVPCLAAVLLLAAGGLAQRALLDELPGDAEAWTDPLPDGGPKRVALELPADADVRGIARCGARLWVLVGVDLHAFAWPEAGAARLRVAAPQHASALAADERWLYALGDREVHVVDPLAGRAVRALALGNDVRPGALACHAGALYLLEGESVVALDPTTGAIAQTVPAAHAPAATTRSWLFGDGERLWLGGAAGIAAWAAEDKASASGTAWPYRMIAATGAWVDGALLVHATWRTADRAAHTGFAFVAVDRVRPAEQLHVKIFRTGDGVRYEVGPKPVATPDALGRELRRIAADPNARVRWPDGGIRPLPVVVEPYPGVRVRDVRAAWDSAVAAGLPDVLCPAVEERVRAQRAKATMPVRDR
jgi:hypothetical protein